MYYEQLCCIMHWFRLNQGQGRALDSFETVQGSVRLCKHVVSKSLFFSFNFHFIHFPYQGITWSSIFPSYKKNHHSSPILWYSVQMNKIAGHWAELFNGLNICKLCKKNLFEKNVFAVSHRQVRGLSGLMIPFLCEWMSPFPLVHVSLLLRSWNTCFPYLAQSSAMG